MAWYSKESLQLLTTIEGHLKASMVVLGLSRCFPWGYFRNPTLPRRIASKTSELGSCYNVRDRKLSASTTDDCQVCFITRIFRGPFSDSLRTETLAAFSALFSDLSYSLEHSRYSTVVRLSGNLLDESVDLPFLYTS